MGPLPLYGLYSILLSQASASIFLCEQIETFVYELEEYSVLAQLKMVEKKIC